MQDLMFMLRKITSGTPSHIILKHMNRQVSLAVSYTNTLAKPRN